MDFNAAIQGIRTALYGSEVRECIASGMEWVKKFADSAIDQAALAVNQAAAAKKSADAAQASETNAKASETASKTSETNAKASATASKTSETNAATSASVAKEYLEQVKTITTGAQGWYATPTALQSAVPIGENGWFAFVGTTDTIWTWDSDTRAWVDTGATSRLAEYYTRDQMDAMLAAQRLKDHPVGSPFLTITDEDPNVTIGGTWVKIAENRAIMGASEDHPAGTTVEAGLPNIEGTIDSCDFGRGFKSAGAFTLVGGTSGAKQNYLPNSSESWVHYYPQISLSAAASNPIYGASNTVQPASYYFNIWIRTA